MAVLVLLLVLQLPLLRVVSMGAKGWGVVAQQHIPAGALVAEYLGEYLCSDDFKTFAHCTVETRATKSLFGVCGWSLVAE